VVKTLTSGGRKKRGGDVFDFLPGGDHTVAHFLQVLKYYLQYNTRRDKRRRYPTMVTIQ